MKNFVGYFCLIIIITCGASSLIEKEILPNIVSTVGTKEIDYTLEKITPEFVDDAVKFILKIDVTSEYSYRHEKKTCICFKTKLLSNQPEMNCKSNAHICFDGLNCVSNFQSKECVFKKQMLDKRYYYIIDISVIIKECDMTKVVIGSSGLETFLSIPTVALSNNGTQIELAMVDFLPVFNFPSTSKCPHGKQCDHQDKLNYKEHVEDTKCYIEFIYEWPTLLYAVFMAVISIIVASIKMSKQKEKLRKCFIICSFILQVGGQLHFTLLATTEVHYVIPICCYSVFLLFAFFASLKVKNCWLLTLLQGFLTLAIIGASTYYEKHARDNNCNFKFRTAISVFCGSIGLEISFVEHLFRLWKKLNTPETRGAQYDAAAENVNVQQIGAEEGNAGARASTAENVATIEPNKATAPKTVIEETAKMTRDTSDDAKKVIKTKRSTDVTPKHDATNEKAANAKPENEEVKHGQQTADVSITGKEEPTIEDPIA